MPRDQDEHPIRPQAGWRTPRSRHVLTGITAFALIVGAVLPMSGCYRRVVDARGLGADSTKLRSEYEREPLDFITTETRRETRDVRPARDR